MDGGGNVLRRYLWANGKLQAQVNADGTIRVAISDELGNVRGFADANGVLTDQYAYQPYGRLIAHTGQTQTPFAFMGDYGVWNAGNGLYLTRHRAYDANLMRFLQPDPLGLQGGRNFYAYALNNPLAFLDPFGLCPEVSYPGRQNFLRNTFWGDAQRQMAEYLDNHPDPGYAESVSLANDPILIGAGSIASAVARSTYAVANLGVDAAMNAQIRSGYAVDSFRMRLIPKGTIVYGGKPMSSWFTDAATVQASGLSQQALWKSLQVQESARFGPRMSVNIYEVLEDIRVPAGNALNNGTVGVRNGWQFYLNQNKAESVLGLVGNIRLH